MKYKFEQFNVEIESPSIEINYNSLVIYPRANQLDVQIIMTVENMKYAHSFTKLDYFKTSSDEEVSRVIYQALKEFEV
jgi:hypothetical protein